MSTHDQNIPPPARSRRRIKRVTYTLQVTCEKPANMNEAEFLAEIRRRVNTPSRSPIDGSEGAPITMDGSLPRVSVLKRIEEFGGGA